MGELIRNAANRWAFSMCALWLFNDFVVRPFTVQPIPIFGRLSNCRPLSVACCWCHYRYLSSSLCLTEDFFGIQKNKERTWSVFIISKHLTHFPSPNDSGIGNVVMMTMFDTVTHWTHSNPPFFLFTMSDHIQASSQQPNSWSPNRRQLLTCCQLWLDAIWANEMENFFSLLTLLFFCHLMLHQALIIKPTSTLIIRKTEKKCLKLMCVCAWRRMSSSQSCAATCQARERATLTYREWVTCSCRWQRWLSRLTTRMGKKNFSTQKHLFFFRRERK